jgi:hypothetical protein
MSKSSNTKIISKAVCAAKISIMIENGRKECTSKEELEEFSIGSLISYMNKNNVFKQGGFIIKFADEYFIYITADFTTKYRARYKNILKMWVGDVYSVQNDIVSIVKTKQKKTNLPIKVNNVIVYYAAKKFDAIRFKHTKKYQNIMKWYDYFHKN